MKIINILLVLMLLVAPSFAFAKEVNLAWEPSPTVDVTGYKLYMSESSTMTNATILDVGLVLTQRVLDLPNELGLYFAVTAYNAVQQESDFSNIVFSPGFTAPAAPAGLGGTTTVNNIQVEL